MFPTTYSRLQDGTIGKPIGTLTWIADCKDPNKLAPVGCPGELLIESPILSRSYVDQGQAGKSFLVDPAWTSSMPVSGVTGSRLLLRTGQLARQNPDGTLVALSRDMVPSRAVDAPPAAAPVCKRKHLHKAVRREASIPEWGP